MEKKKKLYLYPMRTELLLKEHNPYVYNLAKSLLHHFSIVNYGKQQKGGMLDIIKYFRKADIFYFNWIENIAFWKAIIFMGFCKVLGLFNKKVVWTHHNVHSHYKKGSLTDKIFVNFLKDNADYVVIHTRSSYDLLNLDLKDRRVLYAFHPFFFQPNDCQTPVQHEKDIDLLIWGNVRKSKGVHEFLNFLSTTNAKNSLKVMIVGKFQDDEYFKEIRAKYEWPNLDIQNRFIDKNELLKLHQRSKLVFFPYTGSSVLNSGALITSLPMLTPIIGPNKGAFQELGKLGLIHVYEDFEDVLAKIEDANNYDVELMHKIKDFCAQNTWDTFSDFLYRTIK